jgi:Ca-activated chloride channel family protein
MSNYSIGENMSFAEPDYLLWLWLVPFGLLLVALANRARRRALARLGEKGLMARLAGTVNINGRLWRTRLWFIALTLGIFALARPQWGSEVRQVQQQGVQMMIALDISPSMLAEDVRPNRLFLAKQAIAGLMNHLGGDEVGLVLFSGASFIQFPLTSDYNTARSFLANANPNLISRAGTAIGEAIDTAVGGFDPQRPSQKVIVILTDGEDQNTDPLASAQIAAEQGVIIYTIGFGSAEGQPVPDYNARGELVGYKTDAAGNIVLSRLDETALQEIAAIGNGRYFQATSRGDEITDLAAELDTLQQAQLETSFETRQIERYQYFLIIAVLALIVMEFIPERRKIVIG